MTNLLEFKLRQLEQKFAEVVRVSTSHKLLLDAKDKKIESLQSKVRNLESQLKQSNEIIASLRVENDQQRLKDIELNTIKRKLSNHPEKIDPIDRVTFEPAKYTLKSTDQMLLTLEQYSHKNVNKENLIAQKKTTRMRTESTLPNDLIKDNHQQVPPSATIVRDQLQQKEFGGQGYGEEEEKRRQLHQLWEQRDQEHDKIDQIFECLRQRLQEFN